ncbi:hypothetical protein [Streptomyces malaysiensis]|uniref:Uncharacterized protein n=1 Tax=Streptomyces malaysiensis TaxID=92644 RepID=A0A7X5X5J8_STRMQ|nr:hypothetical protein [Streptomyces malaysiensis]NIY66972.1 hypothetical protein [Streptomyces malaysiensis]
MLAPWARYAAAAKPYVLPGTLAELGGGPAVGGFIVPCRVGWGPCYVYGLADEADFRLMWERVIR